MGAGFPRAQIFFEFLDKRYLARSALNQVAHVCKVLVPFASFSLAFLVLLHGIRSDDQRHP